MRKQEVPSLVSIGPSAPSTSVLIGFCLNRGCIAGTRPPDLAYLRHNDTSSFVCFAVDEPLQSLSHNKVDLIISRDLDALTVQANALTGSALTQLERAEAAEHDRVIVDERILQDFDKIVDDSACVLLGVALRCKAFHKFFSLHNVLSFLS